MSRCGFSLLEVILALVIASIGISYLYQGISLSLAAEYRQRFYERCERFLNEKLEGELLAAAQGGDTRAGTIPGSGPEITYEVKAEPSDEVDGLTKVTVTFTAGGPGAPPPASFVTYYTPMLRARKTPEGTK